VPQCAAMTMTVAPPAAKFNIRTEQSPAPTLRTTVRDSETVLWLGPDEYLAIGDCPPNIVQTSSVDVSRRSVGIVLRGPRAAWCINNYCPLDLRDLPVNFCSRTIFGKAEIMLWYRGDQEFHLEVGRSFAPYVWALLEEARREFVSPMPLC
jgi:sarcosine oxidase subunit gamma